MVSLYTLLATPFKKIIADCQAGFAVYGDYDSPAIKEAQAAAFQQILTWLKTH